MTSGDGSREKREWLERREVKKERDVESTTVYDKKYEDSNVVIVVSV